jgi:hypothetical protein
VVVSALMRTPDRKHPSLTQPFLDYFRCPSQFAAFGTKGDLSPDSGYFAFGDAVCYGRCRGGALSKHVTPSLSDISGDVDVSDARIRLPFDLSEVVTNLREERYHQNSQSVLTRMTSAGAPRDLYYSLRPILPIGVRKHLQRIHLSGWEKIAFPRWPVDFSVETLMQSAMELAVKASDLQSIPFIWFWPDGAPSAAIITHDVEGPAGQEFCGQLMDIDDSFGLKSAFQIVPEERYEASQTLFASLRHRGFEVNVHDLNHDGFLFRNRRQFDERAARINRYAREFKSRGFRAGGMFREQGWFDVLDVSFDMSVPNVAHLEPQRGGCCTVMPYFVGNLLELPLTTIQDYSLFHILADHSIELWKTQIELILSQNGLISILTHPDYLIEKRARAVYRELLTHVRCLRDERDVWVALPGDVDLWWRSRNRMTLVQDGDSWRVEGADSHRARVAFARLENDRLVYSLDQSLRTCPAGSRA